jgi:nitrite reductase/ring-hydroxylating ferredoxin subunit
MESTRRSLLHRLALGAAALPFAGAALLALRAMWQRVGTGRPPSLPLARPQDVPETGILERSVRYRRRRGAALEDVTEKLFLTRVGGEIVALSGICTHLQCPVQLREIDASGGAAAPFVCKCHDGRFGPAGEVAGGPPRTPLPRLPIRVPADPAGTIELLGDG